MKLFRSRRWRLRWWKAKWRVRKKFRKRVGISVCILLVAVVLLGISILVAHGPDLRLQRARIALGHGKPDLALHFLNSLLVGQPAHITALCLKARAHMLAMHLNDARLALSRLADADPDLASGHELLGEWVLLKLHRLASDETLAADPQLQGQYEQTLALGRAQADWLARHVVGVVETRFLRARLARADVRYLRAMFEGTQLSTADASTERRSSADPHPLVSPPPTADGRAHYLERQIRMKLAEYEEHLQAVIALQPDHIQAWRRYTSLLVELEDWPKLWAAATRAGERKVLPLNLSVALVDAILAIPDAVHPVPQRIELSRHMLSRVESVNHKAPLWTLARARLHLCADEPDKAQPLLERVLKVWPGQPNARWLLAGSLFNQRMYADAVQILGPLVPEMPDTVNVRTLYGLALMQTGDMDLAESVLREVVRLEPGNRRADAALLALMGQQGRAIDVEENVRRYYQRNGADPLAIRLMSQLEQIDRPDENKSGFARFGGSDRVLELLDWWIESHPERTSALLAKGDVLMTMGRPVQAAEVARRALRLAPNDVKVWRALSYAYLRAANYPAAEAALTKMGEADSNANIEASAELARMYTMLGLRRQAVTTLQRAEHLGPPRLPPVQLTMGRALLTNGRPEQARQHLAAVPPAAPNYAAAQVLLACIEHDQGWTGRIEERLKPLLGNRRTCEASVRELFDARAVGVMTDELIRYSAKLVPLNGLPDPLQTRWLRLQVALAARRGDWQETLNSLDRLSAHAPESQAIHIARIAVLAHYDRLTEASEIFRDVPGLSATQLGPLVAAVLGELPSGESPPDDAGIRAWRTQNAGKVALARFLELMLRGQVQEAARIAKTVAAPRAVLATDLIASPHQPGIGSAQSTDAYRRLGLAFIAYQTGLPGLCSEISLGVIADFPAMALAHALHVQTQLDQDRSTVDARTRLDAVLPHSGLSLLLSAREKAADSGFGAAIDDLRQLRLREPDNRHIRYLMSQLLLSDGQADAAIVLLEELHAGSPLRPTSTVNTGMVLPTHEGTDAVDVAVANDLAYLLATHRPDRLDDAQRIASRVAGTSNASAPILDTLGWIEHLRGNDTRALETLCRAVTLANAEPQIHKHLAAVYNALGNDTWSRYHSFAAGDLATKVATAATSVKQIHAAR